MPIKRLIIVKFKIPASKPFKLFSIIDWIKLLKGLPVLLFISKYRKFSIFEYVKRFKNKDLRNFLQLILPQHTNFSILSLLIPLNWMNLKSTGYPIGGSACLIDMLLKKYEESGGIVKYKSKVSGILEENNIIKGIVLEDGTRINADMVISAADGYDTIFKMLGGKYVSKKIKDDYDNLDVYPSTLQVSFGVNRVFNGEANKTILQLNKPIEAGGKKDMLAMLIRICSFDPNFAPKGKTAVVVNLRTHDYSYWCELRKNNMPAYKKEKEKLAEKVIDILEKRYKGFRSQVEVIDVATPATYIRYTNIWKASYQGWLPTPKIVGRSMKKELPCLSNFYMCGQWVDPPGGISRVMISARQAVQLICAKDKKKFKKI